MQLLLHWKILQHSGIEFIQLCKFHISHCEAWSRPCRDTFTNQSCTLNFYKGTFPQSGNTIQNGFMMNQSCNMKKQNGNIKKQSDNTKKQSCKMKKQSGNIKKQSDNTKKQSCKM